MTFKKGYKWTEKQRNECPKYGPNNQWFGTGGPMEGRKHKEESKQKISNYLKLNHPFRGKHHTVESNEQNRLKHIGKKHNEETKLKMSLSAKGKNTWSKGRILSKETREKMSKSRMGRIVTQETRDKISKSNQLKKRTPEQRMKTKLARSKQKITVITKAQKFVLTALSDYDVSFEFEKSVLIGDSFHPFDIVIGDLYVEIDGCYFHGCLDEDCEVGKMNLKNGLSSRQIQRIRRDDEVNTFCYENKMKLLRIKEPDLLDNFEFYVNKIIEGKE